MTHCNTDRLVRELRGENEIKAILQRLDRLTLHEVQATAAQTLEVVYKLAQNRRVVMDGDKVPPVPFRSLLNVDKQAEMKR